MANEPRACGTCGEQVYHQAGGTCPYCRERFSGSAIEDWADPVSVPFVFPSLEKKRIEADARRQRRANWLRRALGTAALAAGAVLANAIYLLADGAAMPVVWRQSVYVSVNGLVVGPGIVLFFYYSLLYHKALHETDAEFFGKAPKELSASVKTPWPYWRFPVYACPAVFAALSSEAQKSSSWSNLAIASAGSLAAAILLCVFRQCFGGRSVFE